MHVTRQFTLGKNERLKSRKQIEHLFSKGQRGTVTAFRIFYSIINEPAPDSSIKFGVGVSSRFFKKATDRNRIKRLVREAWRLQKNGLKEKLSEQNRQLHVFLIYTGKDIPAYADITVQVKAAIQKLMSK